MINKQSRLAISMMGERPEKYDWVTGEILVERYGQSHPHFLLKQNDRVLAKIDWPFARRGNYTSTDGSVDLDLVVSQMGRTLVAKDLMSHMSTLHVKRTMNRKHSKLMICLSDSDCFLIKPQIDRTKPWRFSLHITKQFYSSELFDIEILTSQEKARRRRRHDARVVAKIFINPIMRWEGRHFHHLMALVVGRIIFIGKHDKFHFDSVHNHYFSVEGANIVSQKRRNHHFQDRQFLL